MGGSLASAGEPPVYLWGRGVSSWELTKENSILCGGRKDSGSPHGDKQHMSPVQFAAVFMRPSNRDGELKSRAGLRKKGADV
jgi:hypothetical protein